MFVHSFKEANKLKLAEISVVHLQPKHKRGDDENRRARQIKRNEID